MSRKSLVVTIVGLALIAVGAWWLTPMSSSHAQQNTLKTKLGTQQWHSKNGARVLFVRNDSLPMIDIRVVFDAGSARDGDRAGLARLTNVLLTQGAGDRDADAIARQLEGVGAQFGSGVDRDTATFALRTLTEKQALNQSTDVLADILQAPTFPQADFDREKQNQLRALQQAKQNPGTLAQWAFYRTLYGDHPYAMPAEGTPETVATIELAHLREFYKRYYSGTNALVVIVGAMDLAQAESLAQKLIGGLPAGEKPAPLPDVPALSKAREEKVNHPSTQTHILVGQPGVYRGDPDYFSLYVGNHVLGGSGLVSRISDEVREKRGLAYSSYSYFIPLERPGPFIMGMQTQNQQADEGLKVLRQTLENFIEQGITEQELQRAKKSITGGFPLRIDSNKKIVEYLAMIGYYDLPLDYLDTFNSNIEAVDLDQVRDAFRRRVHPDRLVTVRVGGDGGGEQGQ